MGGGKILCHCILGIYGTNQEIGNTVVDVKVFSPSECVPEELDYSL